MKDLNQASVQAQRLFLDSFDHVLVDIDGVLKDSSGPIPGAVDCVSILQNRGKIVATASNNTTTPSQQIHEELQNFGFDFDIEDVCCPTDALIAHLRKIKFDKFIYVIGMPAIKEALKLAGYAIDNEDATLPNIRTSSEFLKMTLNVSDKVGAVVVDSSPNLTFLELQKACLYLQREGMLFLVASEGKRISTKDQVLIGTSYFVEVLEDVTKNKALVMAKPSKEFGDYFVEKFGVQDRRRVLFVGDSIRRDMGTAALSGFQKLLVLSGATNIENLVQWSFKEEYKPEYYVDSLQNLYNIIKNLDLLKTC